MIYRYLRFSTDKQDEQQQINKIDDYLSRKGLKADATYIDEATKGDSGRKKTNLYILFDGLKCGDTLVISEISRLTRAGAGDLAQIMETYFKPNKLRLIVCNINLDIDCSDVEGFAECKLLMLATFAKMEKELIKDRTKNALDARKKQRDENGYWISKSGNICTHFGAGKGADMSKAVEAASELRRQKKKAWKDGSVAYKAVRDMIIEGKTTGEIWTEFQKQAKLQPDVYCRRSGKPMTYCYISRWRKEIEDEIRAEATVYDGARV